MSSLPMSVKCERKTCVHWRETMYKERICWKHNRDRQTIAIGSKGQCLSFGRKKKPTPGKASE